jgi:glycosyltransferase involved in cell wall biosynthesis
MPQTGFSVVITCYNHAKYIRDAVDSALAQSYAPSQVIVVDDASTDTSVEVLRRYGDSITLIAHAENQGISRARNAGTAPADGDYIVYLDGDDVLKPWALAVYEQLVQTRHAAIILASLSWFQGSPPACAEKDLPLSIDFVEYKRMADKDRTFRSSASAIVVERRKVLDVDGWTETVAFMQDHDLLAKLAETGPAIQILSPATVFYRSHASNTYKDTGRLLKDCYNLVAAWRSRPGRRASARNLVGGPVFFVLRRACAAKLYRESARVLARSWFVVGAAALSRLRAVLFGRHPSQSLAVNFIQTHDPSPAARSECVMQ